MRSKVEAAEPGRRLIRWWVLGATLPFAAIGFLVVLWWAVDLVWRKEWIYYLAIPAASLIISVGLAAMAFLATKRTWPTALTGTLALVACDVAAGIVLFQVPILF